MGTRFDYMCRCSDELCATLGEGIMMVRQFLRAGHEPREHLHGSSPIKQYTCLFMNQGAHLRCTIST